MKITIVLIAISVLMFSVGCKKAEERRDDTAVDVAKIQSVALSSITATYSNVHSADLVFAGMTNLPATDGVTLMEVRFVLPSSAETNQDFIENNQRTIVRTRAFRVVMSPLGEVQSVSEGKIGTVRNTR
jgi:hypothetical protein